MNTERKKFPFSIKTKKSNFCHWYLKMIILSLSKLFKSWSRSLDVVAAATNKEAKGGRIRLSIIRPLYSWCLNELSKP